MKLNESEFKTLIEHLPLIEVPLDWDGTEGRARIEGHEMKSGIYLVFVDFSVYESGIISSGDYLTPSCFVSQRQTINIYSFDSYIEDIGEAIQFSEEQKLVLSKVICSAISTI